MIQFYIAGQKRAFVLFDGIQSGPVNWFDKARVKSSSWSDLGVNATTNFFSIAGDPNFTRRFYANQLYNDCPNDIGWFVVSSGTYCAWEDTSTNMAILYSNQSTAQLWQSASASRADVFAVYVR
ncbi:MAG: hypothetical protein QM756_15625 [Polyangiaceae bacterium]